MPRPPPRSISGSSTPCSSRTSASSCDDAPRGDLEPGHVEDLRPDVRVDADRVPGRPACSARRTASAACPPASAMPNFWSSCAVAMNSWVCASTPTVTRICTRWRLPSRLGDVRDAHDLLEGVEHDAPDAGLDGPLDLVGGLVVAVQRDALGGHPGVERGGQLAAGADVEVEPLLVQPAHDGAGEERLAGVEDVGVAARRRRARRGSGRGSRPRRGSRRACRTPRRAGSTSIPPTVTAPSASRLTVRDQTLGSRALRSAGGAV